MMSVFDAEDGPHPPASIVHTLGNPNSLLLALIEHQLGSG